MLLLYTGDVASQSLFKFNQTERSPERKEKKKNTRKSRGKYK